MSTSMKNVLKAILGIIVLAVSGFVAYMIAEKLQEHSSNAREAETQRINESASGF